MRNYLTTLGVNIKKIQPFKLKQINNYAVKKNILYRYYWRLNYYTRRLSGRRRVRLGRFFFFRRRRFRFYHKRRLRLKFLLFLLAKRRAVFLRFKFLRLASILAAVKFYLTNFKKLKNFSFFKSRGHYVATCYWLFFLLKQRQPSAQLKTIFTSSLLNYSYSFIRQKRLRLNLNYYIDYHTANSIFIKKHLSFRSRFKKHRRAIRSLFRKLYISDLNKIFFITLRSSKNNTMLSVFDFLGNLLYWKTSKTVGMPGKKKSTKMAAEFLAFHLTRYLRSRKFFSYKFIFTVFGLHRHFKVVFKFIRRNIRAKNIIAMLSKSKVPHNGCFIKKRKHKGRKKFYQRALLY